MGHFDVIAHPSGLFLPEQSKTMGYFRTVTVPRDARSGDEALHDLRNVTPRTVGVEVEVMPVYCDSRQLTPMLERCSFKVLAETQSWAFMFQIKSAVKYVDK